MHFTNTRPKISLELTITGETVEKVPKQILVRDAEKNDLTECVTINDLTIMRGHETPKNHPLIVLKGFSTVSDERDYTDFAKGHGFFCLVRLQRLVR